MSISLKAVIFDLDGTLINSAIQFDKMKRKIIAFLQASGVTPGLLNESLLNIEIIKLAVSDLQKKGFSEKQIGEILSQVSDIMSEVELESVDDASLIEDVPKTLSSLKLRGLKLGVMTRSCREYVQRLFNKFGLDIFFDAVAARDDVSEPKPSPEHAFHLLSILGVKPEETLFVGDHWSDAECANKAGLKFVFISYRNGMEKVHKLGYKTINKLDELVKIINTF
ncbi:MAG: HAD family hydrolase [Candidatus Jordarchaeaceae archaeon]